MWEQKDNCLYKKFIFPDFKLAFSFMNAVAEIAEQMNHHPRWMNEYNIVEIWLDTHSKGNIITEKDTMLATAIDSLSAA